MNGCTPSRRIVGVLLAAGRGTRFGGDKLRAQLSVASEESTIGVGPRTTIGVPMRKTTRMATRTTIGVAAARHLHDALPASIAVVRDGDAALEADLAAVGLRIVRCANADDGMGASLACGVRATRDADGWVVALGDMPWIDSATIRAVAAAIASGAPIAAPSFRGSRGHPVGFAHEYGGELCVLSGDAGARSIIERERARLTLVDVDDAAVLRDVDTPDQC